VDKFLELADADKSNLCRVVVQSSRDVSDAVAKKTGVRHQSPQVLLVKNGTCIWSESHRQITSDALKKALEEL
jgi:thioredoxin 1